jgi:DNA-binding MarR family transcriptional regulator
MTGRDIDRGQATDDATRLASALMGFVRDFGLLQPDRTPCGKPLTVSQAHALALIADLPGITQRDLGDTLGLARASISELVTQLADRGWITQHRGDTDRRQRSIRLTAAGQGITDDVASARRSLMNSLLDRVPVGDRADLVSAVERLADTVRQHRDVASVEHTAC